MPTLIGTDSDDTITGTGDDTIDARGGNDVIRVGPGRSIVSAGAGTDRVILSGIAPDRDGVTVADMIDGGAGTDTLDASLVASTPSAGVTPYLNWTVDGGSINHVLMGARGVGGSSVIGTTSTIGFERFIGSDRMSNTFSFGALTRSVEIIGGAAGNDMVGGSAADILRGGAGADTIAIGAGDAIFGEGGEDVFRIASNDQTPTPTTVDGGAGTDTLVISVLTGAAITIANEGGVLRWGGVSFTSVENISLRYDAPQAAVSAVLMGGNEANRFILEGGGYASNSIRTEFSGGGGNDYLYAASRDSLLSGGEGNDTVTGAGLVYGDDGDDLLETFDFGRLYGGRGNDRLEGGTLMDGGEGDDLIIVGSVNLTTIDGGSGTDTLSFDSFLVNGRGGARFDLGAGAAVIAGTQNVTAVGIETVIGSTDADAFIGDGNANALSGGGGNDVLSGGGGADVLNGDAGDDQLSGDAGDDTLNGGLGADSLKGGDGADLLRGGDGGDTLNGDAGDDVLDGGLGNDTLNGGAGRDTANYSAATAQVVVNLATGQASGGAGFDTLAAVEDIHGSQYDDTLTGDTGNNIIWGGDGNDTLTGSDGADRLDGGTGDDTAVYSHQRSAYTVSTTNGVTTVTLGQSVDTLTNVEFLQFADQRLQISTSDGAGVDLVGTDGRDVLIGTAFADTFSGGPGSDFIDGGDGVDTILLPNTADYYFFERGENGWRIYDGVSGFDSVVNVENVVFGSGPSMSIETASANSFDSYNYIAGYADIRAAFGNSPASAYLHYVGYGQFEGRSANPFNVMSYLASNVDLIPVFQSDLRAGARHYVWAGAAEGRAINSFDGLLYAASNPDLALAFGLNSAAATGHYVSSGFAEGRPTTTFDSLQYLASNADLARAFGSNPTAGLNHYLTTGVREVRSLDTFDARQYAAANADIAAAYGLDEIRAREHYLNYGADELRSTSGFDPVAYLLSNSDLAGRTAEQALEHWLTIGAAEGRAGEAAFGTDQTSHGLPQSGFNSTFLTPGDRDWFFVTAEAGERLTINLSSSFRGGITDGSLLLYDDLGRLVAADLGAAPEARATISFLAPAAGSYYLVVYAPDSSNGSYGLTLFRTQGASAELDKAAFDSPHVLPALPDAGPSDGLGGHLSFNQDLDLLAGDFISDLCGHPTLQFGTAWSTSDWQTFNPFQATAHEMHVTAALELVGTAWDEGHLQSFERPGEDWWL